MKFYSQIFNLFSKKNLNIIWQNKKQPYKKFSLDFKKLVRRLAKTGLTKEFQSLKEKMGFTKKDNILGISFGNKHSTENNIEVIEWNFSNIGSSKIRTSKTEVLNHLNSINQSLGTSYPLSKIYYVPSEYGSFSVYQTLIRSLIKHYYEGKQFKEV